VNVLWGLLNLAAGYFLCRAGKVASGDRWAVVACFAGIAALSIMMSVHFGKRQGK
jgi:hypothetical protein